MRKVMGAAAVAGLLFLTLGSRSYGGIEICSCQITFNTGALVPRTGLHTVAGTGGDIFFSGRRLATSGPFSLDMSLTVDPQNSLRSLAQVSAVQGTVPTFLGFGATTWSLGSPQPGCGNQLVFDFSPALAGQGNVSGCLVLNVTGGFSQTGMVVDVAGTQFDPAGQNPIRVAASSTSFALPPVADIEITKSVTGGNRRTDVVYSATLTNQGTGTMPDNPGSELIDVLPPTLNLTSATAGSGTATANVATNTVTWNGSLPAGSSVTVVIGATIPPTVPPGTTIGNQAQALFDGNLDGTSETTRLAAASFLLAPPATGIPALSGPALGVLVLVLGALAVWRIRSGRREA